MRKICTIQPPLMKPQPKFYLSIEWIVVDIDIDVVVVAIVAIVAVVAVVEIFVDLVVDLVVLDGIF